jgi:hypothetical protein
MCRPKSTVPGVGDAHRIGPPTRVQRSPQLHTSRGRHRDDADPDVPRGSSTWEASRPSSAGGRPVQPPSPSGCPAAQGRSTITRRVAGSRDDRGDQSRKAHRRKIRPSSPPAAYPARLPARRCSVRTQRTIGGPRLASVPASARSPSGTTKRSTTRDRMRGSRPAADLRTLRRSRTGRLYLLVGPISPARVRPGAVAFDLRAGRARKRATSVPPASRRCPRRAPRRLAGFARSPYARHVMVHVACRRRERARTARPFSVHRTRRRGRTAAPISSRLTRCTRSAASGGGRSRCSAARTRRSWRRCSSTPTSGALRLHRGAGHGAPLPFR